MRELDFIANQFQMLAPYVRERYAERGGLTVSGKRDAHDVLTDVDLTVQRRLIEAIHAQWPDDAVVAEEEGLHVVAEVPPARCWFIDPIDGTQNFVRGLFPIFGISLGFTERGELRAGGVVFPGIDQTFLAERGGGATLNGEPIRVSQNATLADARVDIDFSHLHHRRHLTRRVGRLLEVAGQIRSYGAAVAGLCAVAAGQTDAYVEADLNAWDFAAGMLLVEEAGGRVTRFDGSPVSPFAPRSTFAASNGVLHDELLAVMEPGTSV